jgi:hypothetical protein
MSKILYKKSCCDKIVYWDSGHLKGTVSVSKKKCGQNNEKNYV